MYINKISGQEVDAFQYTGSLDNVNKSWVTQAIEDKNIYFKDGKLHLDFLGSDLDVSIGDYILLSGDSVLLLDKAIFKSYFIEIKE